MAHLVAILPPNFDRQSAANSTAITESAGRYGKQNLPVWRSVYSSFPTQTGNLELPHVAATMASAFAGYRNHVFRDVNAHVVDGANSGRTVQHRS